MFPKETTTPKYGVGVGQAGSHELDDYGDDSDGETTTLMTTTTESPVDIVEFECNTKWKGTLKMQDVNYYEVSYRVGGLSALSPGEPGLG